MRSMRFTQAVDDALAQAMAHDDRIVLIGEDLAMLRRELLVRFGPRRVREAPISESAFVGAGVAAAMGGLRPVVELYMVDFLTVAMDALVNHAAKLETFSDGSWTAPVVIRAPCGAGYGDGGQHGQSLWGWLAHIPGLTVVVPSNPADAGALMTAALEHDGPVVFLEPKLLSETWLEFLGSGGRETVEYDVPDGGTEAEVPDRWTAAQIGRAKLRRRGDDLTVVSVGVGVHRALEAAEALEQEGVKVGVLDLRTVSPLDGAALREQAQRSGRVLVVDEDYQGFGLSGEVAALLLEQGLTFEFGRVCTETTVPYSRQLEKQTLPNVPGIVAAARALLDKGQ